MAKMFPDLKVEVSFEVTTLQVGDVVTVVDFTRIGEVELAIVKRDKGGFFDIPLNAIPKEHRVLLRRFMITGLYCAKVRPGQYITLTCPLSLVCLD